MLICVKGEKTQPPPHPPRKRKHTETEGKTGKKYVVAVGGGGGKKTERLRLRHPPGLPPPSWKHRVRGLSLHVLIMINAGTATHTLKPRFWQGSGPALCSDLRFLRAAVNTLVWLVKSSSSQTSKVSGGQFSWFRGPHWTVLGRTVRTRTSPRCCPYSRTMYIL